MYFASLHAFDTELNGVRSANVGLLAVPWYPFRSLSDLRICCFAFLLFADGCIIRLTCIVNEGFLILLQRQYGPADALHTPAHLWMNRE